jgi:hypothetical protein
MEWVDLFGKNEYFCLTCSYTRGDSYGQKHKIDSFDLKIMRKSGKAFFHILLFSLFLNEGASATIFVPADGGLPAKKDSAAKKQDSHKAKTDNSDQQQLLIQPIIRAGVGMLSYIGNVKSGSGTTNIQSPANGRVGFDLGLTQKLSPVTEFSLEFLYGNLAETERTINANWNFQSNIAGGGINLLFKILPKQQVTPYVIIGVESFEFLSRADIYDQYGNEYYSWSDGSLRSLPQSSPDAAQAKILNQSYNYSTDIRSLNLDGSGTYSQQTFAVPVGIGFMFRVGTRADFMIGTTLHYTFTDHIDGLTPQVQGPLQGTLSHDMFLFSYVSLRFNLTRDHPKSHRYDNVVFDPSLLKDTVHMANPGTFDTSDANLQIQYEHEMDSTGKYGRHTVDPFSWKVTNPVAEQPERPVKPSKTKPVAITPPSSNNTSSEGVIFKIQLLATYVPLAEGITFAGINDKASVDVDKGLYRYTTGNMSSYSDAVKYLNQLKALGYTDAFIRATKDGKNITIGQATATNGANAPKAANGTGSAAAIAQAIGTGLVYKIQLGVFGNIAPDQHFMSVLNQFQDLKIVKDNAGLSHYLVGSYSDFKSANAARDQAKAGGIKDVCVMAFSNGHYISNTQAQSMEKK